MGDKKKMDSIKRSYHKVSGQLEAITEAIRWVKEQKPDIETIEVALEYLCQKAEAGKGMILIIKPEQRSAQIFKEVDLRYSVMERISLPQGGLPVEKRTWFGPKALLEVATLDDDRQAEMDTFVKSIDASIKSYLWLPIIAHGEMLGVIILLDSDSPDGFSTHHIENITGMADGIGLLVGYQMLRDIEFRAFAEMMKLAARPLEGRYPYLAGHLDRVVNMSEKVVGRLEDDDLEFDNAEKKELEVAATLHDIGKTRLDERVLMKPIQAGAWLTQAERDFYESHPEKGVKLLSSILEEVTIKKGIKDGILYHHERLDGSGYPSKLRGDEIPKHAKVIGTVCAFDRAFCRRRYHRPDALKRAMNTMKKRRGSEFDSRIVDALASIEKELRNELLEEADKLMAEAWDHADNGRYEEARVKCNEAIQSNRENPTTQGNGEDLALYIAAGELMEEGGYDEYALDYYTAALSQHPTFVYAYYRRGSVYEKMGKLEEAGIDYALAAKLCPSYIEAHLRRGQLRHKLAVRQRKRDEQHKQADQLRPRQKMYEAALESFDKAIKLEKSNVLAYLGKGRVLQDQAAYLLETSPSEAAGKRRDALANYTTSLRLLEEDKRNRKRAVDLNDDKDPEPEIHLRMGLIYDSQKKWDLAAEEFDKAIESNDPIAGGAAEDALKGLKDRGVI